MTIHVTVHHAHGESAPREWEVEVLKPPKGRVVRNEPEDGGHLLGFEVAGSTRELVYRWWDAESARPKDVEPVVLSLSADSDEQEFEKIDEEIPPDEEARAAEAVQDDEAVEDVSIAQNDQAPTSYGNRTDDRRGAAEAEAQPEVAELYGLAAHVDRESGKIWRRLDDVIYRVEQLEQRLDAHVANHPPIPTTPSGTTPVPVTTPAPVTAPKPTSLEAAALLAAAITTLVRDGFRSAADAFTERVGVDPAAGGAGAADRTVQQLTLAAGAASSAIARYAALSGTGQSSSPLAVVAFEGEVQAAGDDYAEVVEFVADAARRTSDPGEESAYAELLTALRADPMGPAIGQLRGFVVGQASADSTKGQGGAS